MCHPTTTPTVNHPTGRGAFRSVGCFFYAPWTSSTMFSRMFDKTSSTKTHINYISNIYKLSIPDIFGSYELTMTYHDIPAYLASTWGPNVAPNVRMFGTAPAQIAPPSVPVELWASICWVAARQFGADSVHGAVPRSWRILPSWSTLRLDQNGRTIQVSEIL